MLAWLEIRGAAPAYAGWVLIGLTFAFWVAAANTMAGWLYVLSGVGAALLLLAAALPPQVLKGIEITRSPLSPVHVGESLALTLIFRNLTQQTKGLLSVQDQIPKALGDPPQTVIDTISPQAIDTWHYCLAPQQRGHYQWSALVLRTGAPLGLFWSRRVRQVQATVLVYPRVLPLTRCPVLDDGGPSMQQMQQVPVSRTGHEGSTRSLRPYRWGDPMRMVHWRSSARFSELRIRELEVLNGGQTFVIGLDTQCAWQSNHFEQAVMAAASLYCYAIQRHGAAQLWTSQWGIVQTKQQALEVLAQIEPQTDTSTVLPAQAILWLTANPNSLKPLSLGSRYILWPQWNMASSDLSTPEHSGFSINPDIPLKIQLQSVTS